MSVDHAIVLEQSHGDRAVELMLGQDKLAPRLVGFLRALMAGAQQLEHELFDLLTALDLDTATGAILDRIGAWVDEPRGSLEDDEYRAMIRVKLLVVWGRGTTDDIIDVALLGSEPSRVTHWPQYPAGGQVQIERSEDMSTARAARLVRFFEALRPAGVRLHVTAAVYDDFGFAEDPDAKGFGVGEFSHTLA